jgi:RND family efflux transporter MFP subunit
MQPRPDSKEESMNLSTRCLSVAVVASLVVALGGAVSTSATAQDPAPAPPGPPPAPVSVVEARSTQFAPLLWAPASVMSREDARVASEQEGRVTRIAEVGTVLRKGDVLAQLDDSLLRLQQRQNESDIERIQAQLDYARSHEQRLGALVQKASIAGSQLDEARSQRRVLEQDLQRAKVALDQTRYRLQNATVRAPFDGTVAERFTQTGEYLGTGNAVARLVNTAALEVRAQAPVNLAARLSPGMDVVVREGETEMHQTVRAVVPIGDESSRQFEVRITLAGGAWPIGSALQVGLPSAAPRDVVAVPRDALLLRANETFVVRIAADDTAQRVPVRTGSAQGELVEVIGEVHAGDRLVVRGGERVMPGQRVTIDATADAPAPLAELAAGGR